MPASGARTRLWVVFKLPITSGLINDSEITNLYFLEIIYIIPKKYATGEADIFK
jgi:hypothetical protein